MADFGIIAAAGMSSIAKLIAIFARRSRASSTELGQSRASGRRPKDRKLTAGIEALDTTSRRREADEAARRLMTVAGIGRIVAASVRAAVHDPAIFRTGRDLGGTILNVGDGWLARQE